MKIITQFWIDRFFLKTIIIMKQIDRQKEIKIEYKDIFEQSVTCLFKEREIDKNRFTSFYYLFLKFGTSYSIVAYKRLYSIY